MPAYPFILLGVIFLAVMVLPPLVAAYIEHRRELAREGSSAPAGTGSSDALPAGGREPGTDETARRSGSAAESLQDAIPAERPRTEAEEQGATAGSRRRRRED